MTLLRAAVVFITACFVAAAIKTGYDTTMKQACLMVASFALGAFATLLTCFEILSGPHVEEKLPTADLPREPKP